MKKARYFVIILSIFSFYFTPIYAQSTDYHIKEQEQAQQQLILNLFKKDIRNAVTTYYKDNSLRIGFNWWDQHYQVVEVIENNKDPNQKYPYIVKFTVLPHSAYNPKEKTSYLGIDTITFGTTSSIYTIKKKEDLSATFLDYQHRNPSKISPQIIRRDE